MTKFIFPTILCGILTGCAGMNSDFDCNKSATDQCLSMRQANALAAQGKSLDSITEEGTKAKKPVSETLSTPPNSPPVLKPLSASTVPPVKTIAPRPIVSSTTGAHPATSTPRSAITPLYSTSANLSRPIVSTVGQVDAYRIPDQTQRLWIAPWVDKDDTFHQPAVVVFIKNKSHWDHSYQVIGEGD